MSTLPAKSNCKEPTFNSFFLSAKGILFCALAEIMKTHIKTVIKYFIIIFLMATSNVAILTRII